jgi:hypothetical protein
MTGFPSGSFDRSSRHSRCINRRAKLSVPEMLLFQRVRKSQGESRRPAELANELHSSLGGICKIHMKEVSMRWPNRFRALLLISGFFLAAAARAQSQADEIGTLPTSLSDEQLQSLSQLSPVATPEPPQPRARRRLPRPPLLLSPEELSYRDAVRKLGVDKHRFVHCELHNGKVRTGVIVAIRDNGFTLKDGIINSQWIPFTDLKATPRAVPAVGTRIGQGFKWAGVIVGCVAASPLFLLFAGMAAD